MPWLNYKATRDSNQADPLLKDLDSRLWSGHEYFVPSEGITTSVHEGTHGVNAAIRNSLFAAGERNMAAFYFMWGLAFKMPQVDFTLEKLADLIPQERRGRQYQVYLVDMRRHWNDKPLYIFDEVSAYINGTEAGIENNVSDSVVKYSFECLENMLYFGGVLTNKMKNKELNKLYDYCQEKTDLLRRKI